MRRRAIARPQRVSSARLRRVAEVGRARMAAESCDHTLQPTACSRGLPPSRRTGRCQATGCGAVLRVGGQRLPPILIESARRKHTIKRGHASERAALDPDELVAASKDDPDQWLDLDSVLTRFESVDAKSAELAKLRVFAGLAPRGRAAWECPGRVPSGCGPTPKPADQCPEGDE